MQRILTFVTRLIRFCLRSLHHRFINWTKPGTASSLMVETLTELVRSKSELVAENALLHQQLNIIKRRLKRPAAPGQIESSWYF